MTTKSKSLQLFPYVVSLYITALILRPILTSKILSIGGIVFPGALLIFPLSFVCNDIFTEVYGYEKSRSIVWAGLFCQVLASIIITLVLVLPSAPFWLNQSSFEQILGQSVRVTAASLVGYFLGELTNSLILSKMKYRQGGTVGWAQTRRFVFSTIIGELVDSVVFLSLAFVGTYALGHVGTMIITTWVLKVIYEVLMLPLSTRISEKIKVLEGINVIDLPESTDYRFVPLTDRKT